MPETGLLLQMLALLLAIGAVAGVLAGLLGVGGGIVLVAAFYYAFQTLGYDSPQLMQICLATSLATIVVTSLRSVLGHNKAGVVDWHVLKTWAPGIVIGAVIGVLVASQLRSQTLLAVFGVLGARHGGAVHGLWAQELALGQRDADGIRPRWAVTSCGVLVCAHGDRWGELRCAFVDALWKTHPPGPLPLPPDLAC